MAERAGCPDAAADNDEINFDFERREEYGERDASDSHMGHGGALVNLGGGNVNIALDLLDSLMDDFRKLQIDLTIRRNRDETHDTLRQLKEEIQHLDVAIRQQKDEKQQGDEALRQRKEELQQLHVTIRQRKEELKQLHVTIRQQKDEKQQGDEALRQRKEELQQLHVTDMQQLQDHIRHLNEDIQQLDTATDCKRKQREPEVNNLTSQVSESNVAVDFVKEEAGEQTFGAEKPNFPETVYELRAELVKQSHKLETDGLKTEINNLKQVLAAAEVAKFNAERDDTFSKQHYDQPQQRVDELTKQVTERELLRDFDRRKNEEEDDETELDTGSPSSVVTDVTEIKSSGH